MLKAALGFRAHSGWAAVVIVAGAPGAPEILDRRRIDIADPKIRGSLQPYHAAKPMPLPEAEAFLARCAAATQKMSQTAVREIITELAGKGHSVAGAGVLLGSGRPSTSLATTLGSHPMIHTAEGIFFRDAIKSACESSGLPVLGTKEKELYAQATAALRLPADRLKRRIDELGKAIGPPWRQDEKLCAVAAWLALLP